MKPGFYLLTGYLNFCWWNLADFYLVYCIVFQDLYSFIQGSWKREHLKWDGYKLGRLVTSRNLSVLVLFWFFYQQLITFQGFELTYCISRFAMRFWKYTKQTFENIAKLRCNILLMLLVKQCKVTKAKNLDHICKKTQENWEERKIHFLLLSFLLQLFLTCSSCLGCGDSELVFLFIWSFSLFKRSS